MEAFAEALSPISHSLLSILALSSKPDEESSIFVLQNGRQADYDNVLVLNAFTLSDRETVDTA